MSKPDPQNAAATPTPEALCARAREVRGLAYAPYSRFRVGAALLGDNGRTYVGVNVENASYGLCLCAERSAIAAAVSDGCQRFEAIAIATGSSPPSPPCGMCRQSLAEFGKALPVHLTNDAGEQTTVQLAELLPSSFGGALLSAGVDDDGAGQP